MRTAETIDNTMIDKVLKLTFQKPHQGQYVLRCFNAPIYSLAFLLPI